MKSKIQKLIDAHAAFSQKKYEKWAALYDKGNFFYNPLRRKLAGLLNVPKGAKILDVASGTGEQALIFAKHNLDVTGVDISEDMLVQARKKHTNGFALTFLQADATSLPFKTNTFDATTITLGLHEMPYEIRILVISEMIRVTKHKGKLIFVDYPQLTSHPAKQLGFHIIKMYEAPMFEDFVRRGLDSHLEESKLIPSAKNSYLGLLPITICIKN